MGVDSRQEGRLGVRFALIWILLLGLVQAQEVGVATGSRMIAVRLMPGQDLKTELVKLAKERHLKAAAVMTCVGSLNAASVRLAGRPDVLQLQGPLEIVSLEGTLSEAGVHLHLAVASNDGTTRGGHLMEGCPIYTTAEIVVVELEGLEFTRHEDPKTGFQELRIRELGP